MAQSKSGRAKATVEWFVGEFESALLDEEQALEYTAERSNPYARYQDDPLGYVNEVLGFTMTPDMAGVLKAFRDHESIIVRSGNGVGKSQPVGTLIPTPAGWREIGSIRVGDYVFGSSGRPVRVTGVFPQGIQETYRVSFNDETSTLASADHLWQVRTSKNKNRRREWSVVETRRLIGLVGAHTHIPMCGAVEYPESVLPLHPYVVGALLGDGALSQETGVRFSSADEEIVELMSELCDADVVHYSRVTYGITTPGPSVNPVLAACRELGMMGKRSYDKRIPEEYLMASRHDRLELLRGLMDTDGTIGKNHSITFTTVSTGLARDVVELVQSLGGTAKVRSRVTRYTHNGEIRRGAVSYRLSIKLPDCPFHLSRKKSRWVNEKKMSRQAHRLIASVERVEDMESVCISVDALDRLYLTESFIVTHNTHCAACAIWWVFDAFKGHQVQVYCAAAPPESNLINLLWAEIQSIAQMNPHLLADCRLTVSPPKIELTPRRFITGVPIPRSAVASEVEGRFSGKHAEILIFILDEADQIPDAVYNGIESCMSSASMDRPMACRMLCLLNPRQQTGPMYRMEKNREAKVLKVSAMTHVNVISGVEMIPGAVTRETTVRRINEWTRPKGEWETVSDKRIFTVPDFLVGEVAHRRDGTPFPTLSAGDRVIESPKFYTMVLAEYPPIGDNRLISDEWIENAVGRWKMYVSDYGEHAPGNPVLGMDTADKNGDYNIIYARYPNGFVKQAAIWGDLDLDLTAGRACKVAESLQARAMFVDATGLGRGIAPRVRRKTNRYAKGVHVSSRPTYKVEEGTFFSIRDQLYWSLREWLKNDPNAMLPDDELLVEELQLVCYDDDKRGSIYITPQKEDMKKLLRRSPDRMESLIMSFHPERKSRPGAHASNYVPR